MDPFAEQLAAGPRKPKSYQATPRLIEDLKKVHGLETASSTINGPFELVDRAAKAVQSAKVTLTIPKDYEGPGGAVVKGVENIPVALASRHPSSGSMDGNKPGQVAFDFFAWGRDGRGRMIEVPVTGVHLFMAWQPIYREDAGGMGHRYIDRLFVSEIGSHASGLEGKLHHLAEWYKQTYKKEPEFVKSANFAPLVHRVVARFVRATEAAQSPQDAAYDFLHKSKIGDLIMGMAAEARKDDQRFGMRDAIEAMEHWIAGREDKKPTQVAAARYLQSDHGKKLVHTLTTGVADALKKAGMKPVGFKDVGAAIIRYMKG